MSEKKKPPDYEKEAACCWLCRHYDGRKRYNCQEFNFNTTLASVCSDFRLEASRLKWQFKRKNRKLL